jgi:glutamyl-tRNA reductase
VHISSASFAYPHVEGSARATLARGLGDTPIPDDLFLLSTCLRLEVAVPGDETVLKERLGEVFGPLPADPEVRCDQDATHHLFRVAAGLESPIIGELEILSQFRHALAAFKHAGPVDGGFLKLLEGAVAAGRELRTALGASPHDTMAAIAAQAVGMVDEVAVVGSGTMATAVSQALTSLPIPPSVRILARSPDLVDLPDVTVGGLGELARTLGEVPALISATAAASRLIDDGAMTSALRSRTTPLLLVDMAMPPDFAPGPDDPVRYLSIDDLAAMALRRARTTHLDEQVSTAADEAYHRFAGSHRVGPVVSRMMTFADDVVTETVARFAGRLRRPEDAEVLRQAAHTVARTIMARPVSAVTESRDDDFVEALGYAFDDD